MLGKCAWFSSLAAALLAGSAQAAFSVTTTSPGLTLDSVTVDRLGNGFTYTAGELINIDVTQYRSDTTTSSILVPDGVAGPSPGNRAGVFENFRLDSGLINPRTSAGSLAFDFVAPVINSDGADIVLFKLTGGNDGPDSFDMVVNGQTVTINPPYESTGLSTNSADLFGISGGVGNLTVLETSSLQTGNNNISQPISAVLIDLSDFGVALGDSVTQASIDSATGSGTSTNTFDPLLLVGLPPVPEPASALLVGMGSLCLLGRRRRG